MSNWPRSWPCFPTLAPEPRRSKLRGKSRRSRSPSPPQRNCHPVVWAAVANRHVSPRYETQSYVGLQLVVKMENYKFSNWENAWESLKSAQVMMRNCARGTGRFDTAQGGVIGENQTASCFYPTKLREFCGSLSYQLTNTTNVYIGENWGQQQQALSTKPVMKYAKNHRMA